MRNFRDTSLQYYKLWVNFMCLQGSSHWRFLPCPNLSTYHYMTIKFHVFELNVIFWLMGSMKKNSMFTLYKALLVGIIRKQ